DLALGSRTVSESEETARACRARGRRAEAFPLDVTRLDSIGAFVDHMLRRFVRIDVLVNNAGTNIAKPALEYTEAEFDTIADVNFKGAFFMTTCVAKRMIELGIQGSIIMIGSQAGVVGAPLRGVYSGAKGAVGQITRTLAGEWASHKITVNTVA